MSRIAVLALASTLFLAPVAYAKHAAFEMPACDKLLEGDGPSTQPVAAPAGRPASKDLTPMKLTDDKDSFSIGADGKVKMEIQQNTEIQPGTPAGPDPTAKTSVVGNDEKLKNKLLKDSQSVKVAPIALQETEGEAQQKSDLVTDAEKAQLSDLWTATINRSPDIQFVINKLQPSSESSHATATALKLIGGALFNIVQVAPLMMPGGTNMGMYMATGSGASILQGLLSESDKKNAKKQQISQEQATMLYTIVRQTAEKVVVEYRKYRQNRSEFTRASNDLDDIKAMVATAARGADPSKAIEMEYTIRKAQRDVEKIIDEAKLHKQQLVDLAGSDAVARLDQQMDDETEALAKLIGSPSSNPNADVSEATAVTPTNFEAPSIIKPPITVPPTKTADTKGIKEKGKRDVPM